MRRVWLGLFVLAIVAAIAPAETACGGSTPPAKACDQTCVDGAALRTVRVMMALAYNFTLQGKEAGTGQDASLATPDCKVQVSGSAEVQTTQGATFVDLTYVFDHCHYLQKDTDPTRSFSMTITGTIHEKGTIAVQPSSTTALTITSDALSFSGTVYDPPIDFTNDACKANLTQDGNHLGGSMCGRDMGVGL